MNVGCSVSTTVACRYSQSRMLIGAHRAPYRPWITDHGPTTGEISHAFWRRSSRNEDRLGNRVGLSQPEMDLDRQPGGGAGGAALRLRLGRDRRGQAVLRKVFSFDDAVPGG